PRNRANGCAGARSIPSPAVAADGLLDVVLVLGEVPLHLRVGDAQVAEDALVQGAGGPALPAALAQDGLDHGGAEERVLPAGLARGRGHRSGAELGTVRRACASGLHLNCLAAG